MTSDTVLSPDKASLSFPVKICIFFYERTLKRVPHNSDIIRKKKFSIKDGLQDIKKHPLKK